MTEGHAHDHTSALVRAGSRHKWRLLVALLLVASFFVVEVIGGLATRSLALLSDAGHMFTDVIGLGMALIAIQIADRPTKNRHRTFGLYRLEILAALANTLLLVGVAIYVVIEAIDRLRAPVEIATTPLLVVASIGLVVNLIAFALLRPGAKDSLNIEGAYLEVVADTLGSIAVIIGAIVIMATGWTQIDAIFGIAIAAFIIPRAFILGRKALRVLLQTAPAHIDMDDVHDKLAAVDGVVDVHDLHVWTLTSDMEVLTVHLMIDDNASGHAVLDRARELLESDYGIGHATLQVEPESHRGCDTVDW